MSWAWLFVLLAPLDLSRYAALSLSLNHHCTIDLS